MAIACSEAPLRCTVDVYGIAFARRKWSWSSRGRGYLVGVSSGYEEVNLLFLSGDFLDC